jgi:hypothetical protein
MARPEQDIWKERIARVLAELKKPPRGTEGGEEKASADRTAAG